MKAGNACAALAVVLALSSGCRERERSESDKVLNESRRLIAAIATNQSIRIVGNTRRIQETLPEVSSREDCRALLEEWRNALYNVPLEGLTPSDRYGVLREASRVLVEAVVAAQGDLGESYEDRWSECFHVIDWLGGQGRRMRDLALSDCGDSRLQHERWAYYQALMEWRESLVEHLELSGFDEDRYPNDVGKMAGVRAEFERLIGRPVRRSEDVKYLGTYRRKVAARIQKERDAAMKVKPAEDAAEAR